MVFVEERLRALGRLSPTIPSSAEARLLFLPVREPTAAATSWKNGYLALFTLGLFELLRTHATASVWAGMLANVESHLGTTLEQGRRVRDYLNLRTLLYFCGRSSLPNLEAVVSPAVRTKGLVSAEAACLFVILHEYGHAAYGALDRSGREQFAASVRLVTPEELNSAKLEELYADRFALTCIPTAAHGVLIHASTLFFTLQAFAEEHGLARSDYHPSAKNRLAALLSYAEGAKHTEDLDLGPATRQFAKLGSPKEAEGVGRQAAFGHRLDGLEHVADALEASLGWRESVASVCRLAESF
ncbi:MAG: hypothetical protein AAF809_10195 [Bacteroidota bacterium]